MSIKKDVARFCKRGVELGVAGAKVVSPTKVFTAAWVRLKCQYGCGGYGACLTCPPHSPTPAETREVLDCYEQAILVHGDERTDIRAVVAEMEREIFLAGYYKAFAYGCGPCSLCRECDLENGCRHPYKARPAMEAAGIDVFATARAAGMPIEVVSKAGQCQKRYGLVLVQ
ncbi:MAG: DUF2284 domain-containing protein [Planctomycetes bacterium]|nr:DUF2284 domain-containing protein [Planctomycetota bacterium]